MDHNRIAQVLIENPNKWAVIHEDETRRCSSRVNNWRHGKYQGKRPKAFTDNFEFLVRSCGYGTYRSQILARYVPDEPLTADPVKKSKKKKAKKKHGRYIGREA